MVLMVDPTGAVTEPIFTELCWHHFVVGYCAPVVGKTCDEVDWFFLENYCYRLLLKQTAYFHNLVDPFHAQKEETLTVGIEGFIPFAESALRDDSAAVEDLVSLFLLKMLWGNRNDLSLSGGVVSKSVEEFDKRLDFLVADHSAELAAYLRSSECEHVGIVLDNCGLELLCDLDFTAFFLSIFPAKRVTLYCKTHPVFVSDAMIPDAKEHMRRLKQKDEKTFAVLHKCMENGRLALEADDFFTSPSSAWELPATLKKSFSEKQLLIFKGDANYRRLLGDKKLPMTLSFSTALSYFGDQKVAAFRTCKSPIIVGITKEAAAKAETLDQEWKINGKFGTIQFRNPLAKESSLNTFG